MDSILDLNIPIMIFIQNLGTWLEIPMKVITFLGNEEFYLLVMPILYWCINASLGIRLGAMLLLSGSVNSLLKMLFHSPRPYWYSSQIRGIIHGSGFGFPSGHSQNAVSLWGLTAASIKRRWAWIGAAVIAFLIGFSRIYLGVHFPIDVLAGWAVGAVMLWAFLALEKPLMAWLKKQSLGAQIAVCFGVSLLIIGAGFLAKQSLGGWQVPDHWIQNSGTDLNPHSLEGFFTTAGTLFGLGAGALLLSHVKGSLDVSGAFYQRLLRYVIGLVGVIAFYAGLDALFPEGETLLALGLRFIRYLLVGLWISLGAPLVFHRLKLLPASSNA